VQLVIATLNEGADRFEGAVDDRGDFNGLLAELDFAARDARHVEQVVDQPDQVLRLSLDHRVGAPRRLAAGRRALGDRQAVRDRRHGVAQLVRENAEEFVLTLVRFGEHGRLGTQLLRVPSQLLVL
jgi:hypothetical protein